MKKFILSFFSLVFMVSLYAVFPSHSYAGGVAMQVKVHYRLTNGAVIENPPVDIRINWSKNPQNPNCGSDGSLLYAASDPPAGTPAPTINGASHHLYRQGGTNMAYVWQQKEDSSEWEWVGRGDASVGPCECVNRSATITLNGETKTVLFKDTSENPQPDGGPFANWSTLLAEFTFTQPSVEPHISLTNQAACLANNTPQVTINATPNQQFAHMQLYRSDDEIGNNLITIGSERLDSSSAFSEADRSCQPGKTYYYWGQGLSPNLPDIGYGLSWTAPQIVTCPCSTGPTPTSNPGGPQIKALKIGQGENIYSGSRAWKPLSGNQNAQSGLNFLNDIAIVAEAQNGTAPLTYYVALYKGNTVNSLPICYNGNKNDPNPNDMRKLLGTDVKNGILLKYSPQNGGTYEYYRIGVGWLLIPSGGTTNYVDVAVGNSQLYRAYSGPVTDKTKGSVDNGWRILFDKNFGSTTFNTAVCIQDSNNNFVYEGNKTPIDLGN